MKRLLWILSFLLIASNAFASTYYTHRYSNVNDLNQYEIVAHYDDGLVRVMAQENEDLWVSQGHTIIKESGNRFILINAGVVSRDPNMSSILAAEAQAAANAEIARKTALANDVDAYLTKEPPIPSSTTDKFFRGDKTWQPVSVGSVTWDSVIGKPTTFTPTSHNHSPSEITGTAIITNDARLSDARIPLAHNQLKATITDFAHTHAESEVTNLTADLAAKQATLTRNTGLIVYSALTNGTTAMAFGTNSTVKVTPTATATFTTTVPAAGCKAYLIILTSGTASYTITFGSGFKTTGTLATGTVTAKVFVLEFISDGVTLYQVARTAAM